MNKITAAALLLLAIAASARAGVLHNEGSNGDLSNNQAAPNAFGLIAGSNSIVGTVGNGDSQDWVAVTVPAGHVLASYINSAYTSGDAQGFTGVQAGSSFAGDAGTAGPYLGYAHFGFGAQNGVLPATNLIGQDLLPIMGNTSIAFGSQGFGPPLGAGTYTFLIQQLGASTSYQFDFNVTAVPEPTSIALLGCAAMLLLARRKKA